MRIYFCICFLGVVLQLLDAQQLQNVPGKLSSLATKLHHDKDIQDDINSLAREGQQVANSLKYMLETEGSKILTEKNRLVKTGNPTDVKVDNLRETLKAARDSLTTEQKDIITLERDIHSSIETCNGRKKEHETSRHITEQKLERIPKEIASANEQIKAHDESIGTLEQSARDLDSQADNLRRDARRKEDDGIFGGVIAGIIGVALAPFTGGASLAVALAAAGINAGVNLNDADDCNRNARRLRDGAASKRQQAQALRSKRDSLEAEKRILESQIRTLQTSSGELQQAVGGLQDVSGYLRSAGQVINDLLIAIQNMDTAVKDADLQSNSFAIIQNAFANHPDTLEAKSQDYLDNLKEKWIRLENILVQHGSKASLT